VAPSSPSASTTGQSRPTPAAAPAAGSAEKPATGLATDTAARQPVPKATQAPPGVSAAPASAPDAGLLGLLSLGAQDGILPEDFQIGPLGAARLLGDEERTAYRTAVTLLDAFARGRIERAAISAGSREALAGTLAFALEQGNRPTAWRLGPPRALDADLVANLRLLGEDGSAEGELYARREGGEVLVSDLQIDPARMRVPRARPDRTFFPSPYRWLLGG